MNRSNTSLGRKTDWDAWIARLAGRRAINRLQRQITLVSILSGTTCSPISLQDFELYLAYRELSLENLQFVAWFLDYQDRFSKLPAHTQALSPDPATLVPDWIPTTPVSPASPRSSTWWRARIFPRHPGPLNDERTKAEDAYPFHGTSSSALGALTSAQLFCGTSPSTPGSEGSAAPLLLAHLNSNFWSWEDPSTGPSPRNQPFRDETLRVVATFMRSGGTGVKELALDEVVRDEVLRGLALTTHPEVFRRTYRLVYAQLEASVRTFIPGQASNINLPKQIYWYLLATLFSTISLSLAIVTIAMYPASHHRPIRRAIRLVSVPFAFMAVCAGYSAWRGFCSEVFGRGSRQLKAWEMDDPEEVGVKMRRNTERQTSGDGSAETDPRQDDGQESEEPRRDKSSYPPWLDYRSHQSTTKDPKGEQDSDQGIGTVNRAVIAPFAFSSEDSPELERCTSNLHRSRSILIDTTGADATLAERRGHSGGPRQTHEIVFTRPKRRATVDLALMRPPVFGPEQVVQDERIKRYHEAVLDDIVRAATIFTVVYTAVLLAIPAR